MLKFFRIYQKYILAIGAVVLMVAFLIPQATQMFTPTRDSQVIGRINGEKLRQRDLTTAAAEMQVLARISPLLSMTHEPDATAWALAIHEAQRLGLSAGPSEVEGLLAVINEINAMLGAPRIDEGALHRIASSVGANAAFVRQALRHWIMIETYRSLALGETRLDPAQRLISVAAAAQNGAADFPARANYLGRPRLSEPLLRRFIVDQASVVSGKLVMIPADQADGDLSEPTEAELLELFEQYKDVLPGPGSLGYRIPPRVKLDYLTIPFDAVLASVDVDEVEAIAFHEQNADLFVDDQGEPLDYAAARADVIDALRQRKAQERIDRMIRRARAILMEAPQFRRLQEQDGYKVIPEDYTPLSFRVVADTLEQDFGIRPIVRYLRDQWLTVEDLMSLESIGFSSLADRGDVFFVDYVLSAREMEPQDDDPLRGWRLQTNVVSQPLRSPPPDNARHLFRLIAAEPDHAPASLDEVRDQVAADARRLAGFRLLSEQVDAWQRQAAEQSLESLAAEVGTSVIDLPAVTRSGADERSAPNLPGVGRDAEFVRRVYEAAEALSRRDTPIEQLPLADRLVVVPIASRTALAVFRIDRFEPISESDYHRLARSPQWQSLVGYALLNEELPDPLARDALTRRTGFVPTWGDEDDEEANPE